jgi:hypothetical protein
MAQKQKGVADAVIKAKLHTPSQNLIQQYIQQLDFGHVRR